MSNAAATLVEQNLGAREPERAEKSVWIATRYNIFFMGAVMILFIFFAEYIIRIFTHDDAVVKVGALSLRIMGMGYIFYGINMVMMQALNGAGDTRTPTIISFIGFWLFQVPLAYYLAKELHWNAEGAFIAIPVAETLIALASLYFFKQGKWKQVKV